MSSSRRESKGEEAPQQWKVILIGDGAVGKTSIANRFAGDGFSQQYKQTIGVDFFLKRLIIEDSAVTMQIWDIGGQSLGSKMLKSYISGAHAVLLCYDMTHFDSFANLEDWYRLVRQAFVDKPAPFIGLIANKCDLSHLRVVKAQSHNRFADENGFFAFTMSAKSGDQVEACFLQIASVLGGRDPRLANDRAAPTVVKAAIVNHARHDPNVAGGQLPALRKPSAARCTVS